MGRTTTIPAGTWIGESASINLERDELKLVADYLEAIRRTVPNSDAMSFNTTRELQDSLALAEASLRRASAELSARGATAPIRKPH